jgi:hypothetical protein
LNKDFYTVAISVVNSDEFLQKYGENNYVTLSDAVYTGMLHKDFKLGYGAYNENGAPMIPDMTIAGTFINGTGDRSDPVI